MLLGLKEWEFFLAQRIEEKKRLFSLIQLYSAMLRHAASWKIERPVEASLGGSGPYFQLGSNNNSEKRSAFPLP